MPPLWKPLSEPTQLREDSAEYLRDQNGARYPTHPIEPAVRAILTRDRTFSTQDIDVFACGSTFGNLLRFARNEDRVFRFAVEEVGKTVFFVRRENSPDERIQDVRGYGHTFPERYTQWEEDVAGSASHQRLISYCFAGLRYIIRSESDGYLKEEANVGISNDKECDTPADLDGLTMQTGGRMIAQAAVFDLKTRAAWKKDEDFLAEQLGRLWVNQTSNFVLAFHERGLFEDVRVQNVRYEIGKWEREHEDALHRLSGLVNKIVACVKSSPDGRCEVRSRERGILELRDVGGVAARALPEELSRFWVGIGDSGSSPEEDAEAGGTRVGMYTSKKSKNEENLTSWSNNNESEKDYTACSAEDCGYCGRCKY